MAHLSKLSNEELLDEYASLERWFGDDFSLSTPSEKDYKKAAALRAEILGRMRK